MKRNLVVSGILIVLVLVLPMLILGNRSPKPAQQAEPTPSPTPYGGLSGESALPQELGAEKGAEQSFDESCAVRACIKGETLEMDLGRYLKGVLAAEMLASFEPEALKAQAVAARTYTLWKIREGPSENHPDADVCDDVNCCNAYDSAEDLRAKWGDDYDYWMARIALAVEETDGIAMTWEEEPILAVFHSSSAQRTAGSEEVWGGSLPYLVSVKSPESEAGVPGYFTTAAFTAEEFKAIVSKKYPAADLSGEPESWARILTLTESGRVGIISLGGVEVSGNNARMLFGLRSAAFTVVADAERVTFTVAGYGHGVGLSQYGANTMAQGGSTFDAILKYYYPGAVLTKMRLKQ